jgi:hypothetical protein
MKAPPSRCVVDTNVTMVANGRHPAASPACVAACARALYRVMGEGHLYLDDGDRIVSEYRANLSASGQPGPGDVFFKWVLTHQWNSKRVTRVPLTPMDGDDESFEELPPAADGTVYDPSDRKFLAVAAAHPDRPPILQSLDSKWWGWRSALRALGVRVHFLCPREIASKYDEKMGNE